MSIIVNLGAIFVGLILICAVIKMVVKKRMTETQSVLWLFTGVVAIILGIFPEIIKWIAAVLGIWYAPSILLLVACVVLLLIVFVNTIAISKITTEIQELALQVTLLKDENKELKAQLEER